MTDPIKDAKETAQAAEGIAKAVPVYQDLLQPSVQEAGKGLLTVTKTVLIALAPLKALVWGYEQFEDFLSRTVSEKLNNTPEEEIISPKPHVAGPALEALRFTGHEESLRDLYANLLAASMDSRTASMAHPGFVEIIKQLTPDEARLMKYFSTGDRLPVITLRVEFTDSPGGRDILVNFSIFAEEAGCENPHLTPSYLDNLARLGLIEIPDKFYTAPDAYEVLENHPSVVEAKEQINSVVGRRAEVQKKLVDITQLGQQFIKACVTDHRELYGTPSEGEEG